MEKLVLIHVDDIEYHKIQNIASRMKITVDRIPEEIVTANYKLGELVNGAYKKRRRYDRWNWSGTGKCDRTFFGDRGDERTGKEPCRQLNSGMQSERKTAG